MSKLALHYFLEGGIHSMDAFAKNKAEAELLKLFREVADQLELDLQFEIEALQEGGVKEFIKVLSRRKNITKVQTFFLGIISGVLVQSASNYIGTDQELKHLEKQEKILNIRKLKNELERDSINENSETIVNNIIFYLIDVDKIILHRSKFYKAVSEESRTYKFSTQELDENNSPLSEEKSVIRADFKKFIVDKIHVDPEEFQDARVEVVAPVLKQGKMKWRGVLQGEPISFNMLDTGFKTDVISGKVSFTSGTTIVCTVEVEKEMDEDGEIKKKQINVYDVVEIHVGETITRTTKAKEREDNKKQYRIDFFKGGDKPEGEK